MNNRMMEFAINGFKTLSAAGTIFGFMFARTYDLSGWWLFGCLVAGAAAAVGAWMVVMYLFVTVVHRFNLALSIKEEPVQKNDGTHEVRFFARGKRQPNLTVPDKPSITRWGGGVKD